MIETVQTEFMARRNKRPADPAADGGPTRSCVGCGLRTAPGELIRCILAPDGGLIVDLAGGAFGRGAWVHARPQCVQSALNRGFARSYRQAVRANYESLAAALRVAAERRVTGLLKAAQSSRKIAFGTQAVYELRQSAKLVLLASDAKASSKEPFLAEAAAQGRLIQWSTKAWYGQILGRGDVAVVAVIDPGLANAVAQAVGFWRMGAEPLLGAQHPKKSFSQATDDSSVVAQPASGASQSADDFTVVESSPGEQLAEIPEVR